MVTGDKSGASDIAVGLAHAWAGDLIGNSTWRDRWLTEGLAAYVGGRLVASVYGHERAALEATLQLRDLRAALAQMPAEAQILAADLRNRDPGAVPVVVLAAKGRLFFEYLEARFGRDAFDSYLHGWVERFAHKSVTTEQFENDLANGLLDRYPGKVSRADVQTWLGTPGLPVGAVLPQSSAFEPVDAAQAAWLAHQTLAKKLATKNWSGPQWCHFLDTMPDALTAQQFAELDQVFDFSHGSNAAVASSWFVLVIRDRYQPAYKSLEDYLKTIGRVQFILPLYQHLAKTPDGAARAKRAYAAARPALPPSSRAVLDPLVTPATEEADE